MQTQTHDTGVDPLSREAAQKLEATIGERQTDKKLTTISGITIPVFGKATIKLKLKKRWQLF